MIRAPSRQTRRTGAIGSATPGGQFLIRALEGAQFLQLAGIDFDCLAARLRACSSFEAVGLVILAHPPQKLDGFPPLRLGLAPTVKQANVN
jgi:hypothetical protein